MPDSLQFFHFLRPAFLLGLPVIAIVWYLVRPRKSAQTLEVGGVAPHLVDALKVGSHGKRRFYPIDGTALVGILLALAAAGPAWTRAPNPLVAQTAPMVIALKVTKSMEQSDLPPSRLDRARFKILDLIETRAGARTGLVAYAGTAHSVSPLTDDPNILRPLLEGLTPKVMPEPGDDAAAALAVATGILNRSETPGAVLFVLDDLNPRDVAAFSSDPDRPAVIFLVAAPAGQTPATLSQIPNATIVQMTADDGDLQKIERKAQSVYAAALAGDERLRWQDRGWWLAWPAAVMLLFWFRRGWTMTWVRSGLLAVLLLGPGQARAEGWFDWFFTPDQQGWLAYQDKRFSDAGDLFEDPYWRGYAKYKAGEYEDAAAILAGLDTAEAAFTEGMALVKSRSYRPAIAAFETALERRPDYPEAQTNLEISRAILEYVEETREQSDTGEEAGIGADDVVFDNEDKRGSDTQIEATDKDAAPVSAEQWISSIDTDTGDFLRSRFLLENAERGK